VPAHASVLGPFDPEVLDPAAAEVRLRGWLGDAIAADLPEETGRPLHEIPVRYGGDDGPDLLAVAGRLGLDPDAVVRRHTLTEYRVLVLGFAPGFAYLGTLPPELALPRRAEPRTRVPSGSVAIAGRQTAVYPLETAGGWHLIGRTDIRPWDLERDPPALFAHGDRVRFVPV
jgi:KipI family sensor histidine kinase inhibitor